MINDMGSAAIKRFCRLFNKNNIIAVAVLFSIKTLALALHSMNTQLPDTQLAMKVLSDMIVFTLALDALALSLAAIGAVRRWKAEGFSLGMIFEKEADESSISQ